MVKRMILCLALASCTDDVVVGAALTIDDGVNPAVVSNTTVSIECGLPST